MAKLRINGDTSGYVDITVPSVAGAATLDLASPSFSGDISCSSGSNKVSLATDGAIEITRGADGAYIDFKTSSSEDFDTRIQSIGNGLSFSTGGNGSALTRMTVDSSGRVTMPYQPAFSAYATAGNIAANSTMPYNTTVINRGNIFNTSTYRFTAPVSGVYLLSSYDIGNSTGTTRLMLYRNGVDLEASNTVHQLRGSNGANYTSMTSFWLVTASANDYFYVYVTETASYGTAKYSWFSGYLIG